MTPSAPRPRRRRRLLVALAPALVVALGVACAASASSEPPALLWVVAGTDDPPDVRRAPDGAAAGGAWTRREYSVIGCFAFRSLTETRTAYRRAAWRPPAEILKEFLGLAGTTGSGVGEYCATTLVEHGGDGRAWQAILRPLRPEEGRPRADLAGRWEVAMSAWEAPLVLDLRADGSVDDAAGWVGSWRASGRVLSLRAPDDREEAAVLVETGGRLVGHLVWGDATLGTIDGRRVPE